MLDSLPYDILELIVFRLCLLSAEDIGALKQVCKGLNSILTSEYDVMRHHALGGLRHCLDSLLPDAVLYLLKHSYADPTVDRCRPLRVAIRTKHVGLFKWLLAGGYTRFTGSWSSMLRDLTFALEADNYWAFVQILKEIHPSRHFYLFTFLTKHLDDPIVLSQAREVFKQTTRYTSTEDSKSFLLRFLALAPRRWAEELLEYIPEKCTFNGYDGERSAVEFCVDFAVNPNLQKVDPQIIGRAIRRVSSKLSTKHRTILSLALMGLGRPDFAIVAAPHLAVFEFVIEPTPPEDILAAVAAYGNGEISRRVFDRAPTHVLVRIIAKAAPEEFIQKKIRCTFRAAFRRSSAELRKVLMAAPGAALAARFIDRILKIRDQRGPQFRVAMYFMLHRFSGRSFANTTFGARGRGDALRYELFALSTAYFSFVLGGPLELMMGTDFDFGFRGVSEETARVLAEIPGEHFSMDRYYFGQRCWDRMEAPADDVCHNHFAFPVVFSERKFRSVDKLFEKAEAWAAQRVNMHLDHDNATDTEIKFQVSALAGWIKGAIVKGEVDDDTIVAVIVEANRRYKAGELKCVFPLGIPMRFAPKLAAAGNLTKKGAPATLGEVPPRFAPDNLYNLERLELVISGVWTDPQ